LITHAFDALAKSEKEAFGAPDHPVLVVQHPIGTVKVEEVNKRADAAFDKLVEILVEPWTSKADRGVRFRVSGARIAAKSWVELNPDTRHLKPLSGN
jgi:hypothetical protein